MKYTHIYMCIYVYMFRHTHTGIPFSLKMEGNSNICLNMDESWGHYTK